MAALEQEKRLIRERIANHRTLMRGRIGDVRRALGPVSSMQSIVGRVLPYIRPVASLAGTARLKSKGRLGTIFRLGLIASIAAPVIRSLFSDRNHDV